MNSRYRSERLSCEECGMKFIRRSNLNKHLLKYHTGDNDFERNQNLADDSLNVQAATTNQFGSKMEFINRDVSAMRKIKRVIYFIPVKEAGSDSATIKPTVDSNISPQHQQIELGPGLFVPDIEAGSSSGSMSTLITPSTNSNNSPQHQQIETGPGKIVPDVKNGSSNETDSNLTSADLYIDPKRQILSMDSEKFLSILQAGILKQENARSVTKENLRHKVLENFKEIKSLVHETVNNADK